MKYSEVLWGFASKGRFKFIFLLFLTLTVQLSKAQEPVKETKELQDKVRVAKSLDIKGLQKFSIGLSPNVNFIIGPISKNWGSKDEGLGFFQGYGLEFNLGYKTEKGTIVSLIPSFSNFQVARRTKLNKEVLYSETYQLNSNSIKLGITKNFAKKSFLTPSFGFQFLNLKKTDILNYENELGIKTFPSAGMKIGKLKETKHVKLEYGLAYNFIYITDYFGIDNSLHIPGIFVGIKL